MSIGWVILLILVGWVLLTVLIVGFFALLGSLARIADCIEVWVNLKLAREEESGRLLIPDYPPPEMRDQ